MAPIEDLLISCILICIIMPAILILILSAIRCKEHLSYWVLRLAFKRLPAGSTCTICLESNKEGGLPAVFKLPCGHWFHKLCLTNWLSQNNNCPNCRQRVKVWNGQILRQPQPWQLEVAFSDEYDDEFSDLLFYRRPPLLPPNLGLAFYRRRLERTYPASNNRY